jgi:hypothetical protein
MDLRLFFSVIGRFKLLVIAGVVLAACLAVFSVGKPELRNGKPALKYRKAAQYGTYTRVLLTAPTVAEIKDAGPTGGVSPLDIQSSIQAGLPGLATVYASFVGSDAIRSELYSTTHVNGLVAGSPVKVDPFGGGGYLPIVSIEAVADTPEGAVKLGGAVLPALKTYLKQLQRAGQLPLSETAGLTLLNQPAQVFVVRPHSKMLPIGVFIVALGAVFGLAFLLENLRPRVKLAAPPQEAVAPADLGVRGRAVS